MHSALLIDEILQFIFEAILDSGKSSLCAAARCCRAWKDPALDRIWRRLPSAIPLLSLLPGFSMENGSIRLDPTTKDTSLTAFHPYAIRVKHIVHCHPVLADSASLPTLLLHQLRNLESARIKSRAAGEVALYMSLAPRLRALKLQVGYAKSNTTSMSVHDMMLLLTGCTSLERLSLRGHSSECLQMPLRHLAALRSLSLHLSSLTEQTLMAVSMLPVLADFDVHANRLSYELLSAAMAARDTPFFPALEKLKIRAEPALIALILEQLPPDNLQHLHIDTSGPGSSAFNSLVKTMASLPLRELTLEQAISADESEDAFEFTPDKFFTLDHLRPLSKLALRRLIIDTSLPLDLTDGAIEELVGWWPLLERLELGGRTALENAEATWSPRTTLASLCMLAKGCKNLGRLVITMDVDAGLLPDLAQVPCNRFHPLVSLSISSRAEPEVDLLTTVLLRLFPFLVDVSPGFVAGHEETWEAVYDIVSAHVRLNVAECNIIA